MAMEDLLPTLLILLVIYLVIRYFSKSNRTTSANPDSIPGVTPAIVETVHSAFPDVPIPNLIYSLSKTKSGQATSEEIIERGFLPAPPASFRIPPSLLPAQVNPPSAPGSPTTARSNQSAKSTQVKGQSLIQRYGLSSQINTDSVSRSKGKDVDPSERGGIPSAGTANGGVVRSPAAEVAEGKKRWEETREGREKGLRERKEKMILEARRRLMEKQAQPASE